MEQVNRSVSAAAAYASLVRLATKAGHSLQDLGWVKICKFFYGLRVLPLFKMQRSEIRFSVEAKAVTLSSLYSEDLDNLQDNVRYVMQSRNWVASR